ncbi:MAG: RluA family pseudouridine synthase [Sphaerochaetaceae bacterium]|jgi:23S rRNA pseudouridine1911/1915/1917 synthase
MSDIASRILYEDNHLIIVNKKCGELVQRDKTGDDSLSEFIKEYLRKKYDKKGNVYLGLVHRLDRPTSGIVIYTKTEKALVRMNALFKDVGSVEKRYWVVVDKMPPSNQGTLENYLKKNSEKNKSFVVSEKTKGSKLAKLNYQVLSTSDNFFLLEIELLTGRHHQIRAQLANLGICIKGDLKYGFNRANKDKGIHLHARYISFIHPVRKEEITLTAEPPSDPLWDFFASHVI